MSIIRKILKKTKDFTNWKYLVKSNFNLTNFICNSADLKLEELRLERTQLEARSGVLLHKQRCLQSMLTDLTRSIKQMEFDIVQKQTQKPTEIAREIQEPVTTETRQAGESQQKI